MIILYFIVLVLLSIICYIGSMNKESNFAITTEMLGGRKEYIPPSPDQKVKDLADRFRRNEFPHNLEELELSAVSMYEEWSNDGYSQPLVQVDADSGELVMIASRKGLEDPQMEMDTPIYPIAYRFLRGNETKDIVIPAELRGDTIRWRNMTGSKSVFDFSRKNRRTYEASPSVKMSSEDIEWLQQSFGEALIDRYDHSDEQRSHTDGMVARAPGAEGLSNLEAIDVAPEASFTSFRIDNLKKLVTSANEADEVEAYEIEDKAKDASNQVKKGLFMSAKKLDDLRQSAYQSEINRLNQ